MTEQAKEVENGSANKESYSAEASQKDNKSCKREIESRSELAKRDDKLEQHEK